MLSHDNQGQYALDQRNEQQTASPELLSGQQ